MKKIIHEAMQQDFSSQLVLGRMLYGISFVVLGFYSVLKVQTLAGYSPSFLPDILAPVTVFLIGTIFAVGGFLVATGRAVARGASAILWAWVVMAVFNNLFSAYFDVREFFLAIALIGASLVIKTMAEHTPVAASGNRKEPIANVLPREENSKQK